MTYQVSYFLYLSGYSQNELFISSTLTDPQKKIKLDEIKKLKLYLLQMDSSENNDLKDLKSFFSNRSKEIKEEKNQTLSIIGAHLEKIDVSNLSEIEKQQNKKELTHLGGFLSLYDDSISIEEASRTSPDFLIRKNKKVIALALAELSSGTDLKNTLLAAITKQETILNAYKSSSNASEFWLLAVLEDLDAIDHSIKEDLFTTAFDKVVVYDFSRSEIIELKRN